jgi:hypothetical protein
MRWWKKVRGKKISSQSQLRTPECASNKDDGYCSALYLLAGLKIYARLTLLFEFLLLVVVYMMNE